MTEAASSNFWAAKRKRLEIGEKGDVFLKTNIKKGMEARDMK